MEGGTKKAKVGGERDRDVIVVGSLSIDLFCRTDKLPAPGSHSLLLILYFSFFTSHSISGETVMGTSFAQHFGGKGK